MYSKNSNGCEFQDQREISYQSKGSTDLLMVKLVSEESDCLKPSLEVTIRSSSGKTILRENIYIWSTMYSEDSSYVERLQNAQDLFYSHVDLSILDTSELPDRVICEKSKAECAYIEFPNKGEDYSDMARMSELEFQEYLNLKQRRAPMVILETNIELWTAYVYDDKEKKAIPVLNYGP